MVESSHTSCLESRKNNRERLEIQKWKVQLCKILHFSQKMLTLCRRGHSFHKVRSKHRGPWCCAQADIDGDGELSVDDFIQSTSQPDSTCQLCNSRNRPTTTTILFLSLLFLSFFLSFLLFDRFWQWSVEVCSDEKLELKAAWSCEEWRYQRRVKSFSGRTSWTTKT